MYVILSDCYHANLMIIIPLLCCLGGGSYITGSHAGSFSSGREDERIALYSGEKRFRFESILPAYMFMQMLRLI